MANWSKKDIEDRVFNYTNEELLHRFSDLSGGDDFDGCFTAEGDYEFERLQLELKERLVDFRFITKTFKWYD